MESSNVISQVTHSNHEAKEVGMYRYHETNIQMIGLSMTKKGSISCKLKSFSVKSEFYQLTHLFFKLTKCHMLI